MPVYFPAQAAFPAEERRESFPTFRQRQAKGKRPCCAESLFVLCFFYSTAAPLSRERRPCKGSGFPASFYFPPVCPNGSRPGVPAFRGYCRTVFSFLGRAMTQCSQSSCPGSTMGVRPILPTRRGLYSKQPFRPPSQRAAAAPPAPAAPLRREPLPDQTVPASGDPARRPPPGRGTDARWKGPVLSPQRPKNSAAFAANPSAPHPGPAGRWPAASRENPRQCPRRSGSRFRGTVPRCPAEPANPDSAARERSQNPYRPSGS